MYIISALGGYVLYSFGVILGGASLGKLCRQSGLLGVLKGLEVSKVLASVHSSSWAIVFASGFFAYSSKCVIDLL